MDCQAEVVEFVSIKANRFSGWDCNSCHYQTFLRNLTRRSRCQLGVGSTFHRESAFLFPRSRSLPLGPARRCESLSPSVWGAAFGVEFRALRTGGREGKLPEHLLSLSLQQSHGQVHHCPGSPNAPRPSCPRPGGDRVLPEELRPGPRGPRPRAPPGTQGRCAPSCSWWTWRAASAQVSDRLC